MQGLSSDIAPHIYYTVSELNLVRDVTMLKNASVKTVGYFKGNRLHGVSFESVKETAGSEDQIALDLTHQKIDFACDKPYLIIGSLFTTNSQPVLLVKAAKVLDLGFEQLRLYHEQLTTLRERSPHFQDLIDVSKEKNWI